MPSELIKQALTVGVVAVSVSLTGCGSEPEGTAAPTAAPKTTPAVTAPISPTATPSPSATGFPRAKDGRRLRACRDATCEVLVSSGQSIILNDRFGIPSVDVTVEGGSVTFRTVSASGFQSTLSEQTPDQGGPSRINDVSFQVLAVRGKRAIIKIAH
jgi:hypothetical protein